MRLALVSDVHADHWKGTAAFAWKRAPLADVLLVAGDLHDDQDGSAEELRKAALVRHARACAACLADVKLARLCDLEHGVDCPRRARAARSAIRWWCGLMATMRRTCTAQTCRDPCDKLQVRCRRAHIPQLSSRSRARRPCHGARTARARV
jgi:hypothetical protein